MVPNLKILNVGARWLDSRKLNISDVIPASIEHFLLTYRGTETWSIYQLVEFLDLHPSLSFLSLPKLEDMMDMDMDITAAPVDWKNQSWPNLRELILDQVDPERQMKQLVQYIPSCVFPNLERLSVNEMPWEETFRPLLSMHGANLKAIQFAIYEAETGVGVEKAVLETIHELCPSLEEIGLFSSYMWSDEDARWPEIDKAFERVTVLVLELREYRQACGEDWEWFLDNAFRWSRSMLPNVQIIRFIEQDNWEDLQGVGEYVEVFLRNCGELGIKVENNFGVQLKLRTLCAGSDGKTDRSSEWEK